MCPDTSLEGGYYATTLCSTIPVVAIGHWLWIRESELGGGRDFPGFLVYYPFRASVVQLWDASLRIDDKVGLCLIHLSIPGIPFLGQGGLCLGLGVSAWLLGCCSVLLVLLCRIVLRQGLAIPSFGFSLHSYIFWGQDILVRNFFNFLGNVSGPGVG